MNDALLWGQRGPSCAQLPLWVGFGQPSRTGLTPGTCPKSTQVHGRYRGVGEAAKDWGGSRGALGWQDRTGPGRRPHSPAPTRLEAGRKRDPPPPTNQGASTLNCPLGGVSQTCCFPKGLFCIQGPESGL